MNYLIEYTYTGEIEGVVMYVVAAIDERTAIEMMNGMFHSGFSQRAITPIHEEEYNLFKDKKMIGGVYRVTRDTTSIVQQLNNRDNKRAGMVIHEGSFTIMSAF